MERFGLAGGVFFSIEEQKWLVSVVSSPMPKIPGSPESMPESLETMTGINSLFEDCHTSLKKCVNVRKTESNIFLKRKIQRP